MSLSAHSLATSIGWTLVHFTWQGILLGCATAVALTVMRNARPEHRYTVACTALLLCLAWPAFELYARLADSHPASAAGMRIADQLLLGAAVGADGGMLGYLQGKLLWIVGFWAACAGALAVRMALGLLWVGRVARSHGSDPRLQACVARLAAQFGVGREVRLRVVDNLASPITAGWWRPVVLVPASLVSGMPHDLLEALLAHEMAHVKRFDYLVNLGQNVVEVLLFYHPAVWWISGRIRIEREQIADDLAARQLGEPRRLALALSELERLQFSTHHLAQAANGGDLMSRIKRLIHPDTQALNWKAAIPVFGLAAACLAGCAHTPAAAPAPADAVTASQDRPKASADFQSCEKPRWPKQALRNGVTGTVTLGFLVGPDGKVIDSRVANTSGDASLDEAARSGIALCHFKPAIVGGVAVESDMTMKYTWTLRFVPAQAH
ncbi:MAG TPA: M56 family metallopeptidase [Telluria sp.]|nr:M56 family metallopeptidase [Telluria sp.]